jgi:hypothetical protein
MNVNETLYVGGDFFTLRTPPEWMGTIRVYEVTAAARCTPLRHWFCHDETLQIYVLEGSFGFEVGDRTYTLEKGHLLCVPAGCEYRLQGKSRDVGCKLHIYAPTCAVEDSWRSVTGAIREDDRLKSGNAR